jgi:hypothetical protein
MKAMTCDNCGSAISADYQITHCPYCGCLMEIFSEESYMSTPRIQVEALIFPAMHKRNFLDQMYSIPEIPLDSEKKPW